MQISHAIIASAGIVLWNKGLNKGDVKQRRIVVDKSKSKRLQNKCVLITGTSAVVLKIRHRYRDEVVKVIVNLSPGSIIIKQAEHSNVPTWCLPVRKEQ